MICCSRHAQQCRYIRVCRTCTHTTHSRPIARTDVASPCVANLQAHGELQRRVAVRHRYLTTLSMGMRALRGAVARRRAKHALYERMGVLAEQHLARRAVRAWTDVALPPGREGARARAAAAARMHSRRLMGAALSAWRHGAALLQVRDAATPASTAPRPPPYTPIPCLRPFSMLARLPL